MKCSLLPIEAYPFGDDLLLFQKPSGKLYVLNAAGRFLWEQLPANEDPAGMAKKFAEQFVLPYDLALHDVHACLAQWREAGIFLEQKNLEPPAGLTWPFATEDCGSYLTENSLHFQLHETFALAGTILRVNAENHELLQAVCGIFPHLRKTGNREPDLSVNLWQESGNPCAEINGRMMRPTDGTDTLCSWIVAEFVDRTYRNRNCLAVLHAGAVGIGGQAVVLAGASGSGKSTLVAGLQQAGYTYLCDDVCPLQAATGELIPVPMSQNIKKGSWRVMAQILPEFSRQPVVTRNRTATRYVRPQAGSPADWDRSWQVSTLIFPSYQPGAATVLTPVPPVTALSLLLNSGSLCGDSIPDMIGWVAAKQCFTMTYSSLPSAGSIIRQTIV